MPDLKNWLRRFVPPAGTVDRFERMRASIGALFGLVVVGLCSVVLLGKTPATIWLVAPMGASAVLLFAVPASPLAQPWSIIGGNIVAAIIGVTCAKLIGEPVLAAGVAGATAIGAMFALRCLHPPSGAVALTAVLGGPAVLAMGYDFVIVPVALNSTLLLLTALFYNNVTGRRYPHIILTDPVGLHDTKDVAPTARIGMTREDLDIVLARYNQVLDISLDDLEQILQDTERQVYLRRFGATRCEDVMSSDVISVAFSTELRVAWDLLHQHRLTVLPVLDRTRRVIGVVSVADFIRHANLINATTLAQRLKCFLLPNGYSHSEKPEVVGQIMQKNVVTARADQPVIDLVTLMSNAEVRAAPVIDDARRLVGMITQSDVIAALYENNLQAASGAPAQTVV